MNWNILSVSFPRTFQIYKVLTYTWLLGPYLVFMASTINGYEGTGRSLSLKLLDQLRQQSNRMAVTVNDGGVATRTLQECELKVQNNLLIVFLVFSCIVYIYCITLTTPNANILKIENTFEEQKNYHLTS